MAIAFLFLSILGVDVLPRAGDTPGMIIAIGLSSLYAIEVSTRWFSRNFGHSLMGLLQFVTGIWLRTCTYP
jgi:hypothetical protein